MSRREGDVTLTAELAMAIASREQLVRSLQAAMDAFGPLPQPDPVRQAFYAKRET